MVFSLVDIKKILIVIPAHNEESCLDQTLSALKIAILNQAKEFLDVQIRILVASNGSVDRTIEICKLNNVDFVDWPAIGKWDTLKRIVLDLPGHHYFLFLDAGTIVPAEFFDSNLLAIFKDPSIMGFTFNYESTVKTKLEKIYWLLESFFKILEKKAGGLVAVSGFLVGYQANEVKSAFEFLDNKFPNVNWLNDDVVLPLTMRMRNQNKSIVLVSGVQVGDVGLEEDQDEYRRRHRMLKGNIQWIKILLPELVKSYGRKSIKSCLILILLSRRIIKIFWAYILILFLFLPISILPVKISALYVSLFIGLIIVKWKKVFAPKMFPAFVVSIKAPLWIFQDKSDYFNPSSWR